MRVQVSARPAEAALFGRHVPPIRPDARPRSRRLFDEAADHVEVVRRLWDSWEDDAEIRDVATGRFIDRDKLHYIDFEGAHFSVEGPSITPRPPQGQPVVTALAHVDVAVPARRPQRRRRVRDPDGTGRDGPRDAARSSPRSGGRGRGRPRDDPLHVFGDLVVLPRRHRRRPPATAGAASTTLDGRELRQRRPRLRRHAGRARRPARGRGRTAGLTGFRLRPAVAAHDLPRITRELVPELQRRGAVPHRLRGRHPARAARPRAPRRPLRHRPEEDHRDSPSRSTSPPTSPASTTRPCGATRRPAATSSSSPSCTSRRPPSARKFDFLFLAEGLRLREQGGKIYDLDVVGRPDNFIVLVALAAVTERIGLAGTINSTFNEPYDVARKLASPRPPLRRPRRVERRDQLGRVHRRELPPRRLPAEGQALPARPGVPRRPRRSCGTPGTSTRCSPTRRGRFLRHADAGRFEVHSDAVRHRGRFTVPRSPQGRPVIIQAGDSEEGREFAAASADAIFTRHAQLEAARSSTPT